MADADARSSTPTARDRILTILETIQLAPEAARLAGLLSHGQKQWLEIGMLLMQEPQLLLLDEPVAGMTDDETMRSAELFESLAGDYTLVVVEHDMDFVAKIADRVTVLHEGHVLAEGSMEHVQQNEQVIEVFLGRDGTLAMLDGRKTQPVLRRQPHPARRVVRRAGGPVHDAARPQRRRQDDAAALPHGPHRRALRRHPLRRREHRDAAAVCAREPGPGLRAAGARHFPAPHRAENLQMGLATQKRSAGIPQFIFEMFPVLKDMLAAAAATCRAASSSSSPSVAR